MASTLSQSHVTPGLGSEGHDNASTRETEEGRFLSVNISREAVENSKLCQKKRLPEHPRVEALIQ